MQYSFCLDYQAKDFSPLKKEREKIKKEKKRKKKQKRKGKKRRGCSLCFRFDFGGVL
jgi:hypothetical protein